MKLNGSVTRKIAAFRVTSCTRRSICPQLCSSVLILALLVLPLAGTTAQRPPILTPLSTALLPLGLGLQSPSATLPYLLPFAASGKLVLGILPRAAFAGSPDSGAGLPQVGNFGLSDSGAIGSPKGRSPPFH